MNSSEWFILILAVWIMLLVTIAWVGATIAQVIDKVQRSKAACLMTLEQQRRGELKP